MKKWINDVESGEEHHQILVATKFGTTEMSTMMYKSPNSFIIIELA